jgi:membrane-bound ClpP family serine protease
VVEALDPAGIVRVAGEDWTAVSLNGPVPAGGRVQVVSVRGVRLEVWGEDLSALQLAQPADEEAAK